ncbi:MULTISPECIES: HlyD family efflux transporter periplasmic adaptor subunit [Butyricimonas]|uniref:HlyD family efflux transporter periplasmic adaptor subunit n=1 Tax=Butyricimonas TaxID=574697 RepID=UPI0007FB2CFE|nr:MULTISPECIES: HlyD family efflux transporter periplasmic adaptor subunit [Butyricimonas]
MKIFPDDIVNQSYEQIVYEHGKCSNILYNVIIFTIIGIFVSFFFIFIDVGTVTLGSVQNRGEVNVIIAPADGVLGIHDIRENAKVKQGDTIFTIIDQKSNGKYTVCSPISGVCVNTGKLVEGLRVLLGQQLMEIVPDSEFCVECNVLSKDIGLLRVGLPCKILVDAYNYNQWGMLNGVLIEISEQPIMSYQGMAYKVYCSVSENFLELKNGYRGYLKRGMSVNCRFVINRRRIIDLLYDKVENWINPLK